MFGGGKSNLKAYIFKNKKNMKHDNQEKPNANLNIRTDNENKQ